MKTDYAEASGHNLVTSAAHGGARLTEVALGAVSNAERKLGVWAANVRSAFAQLLVLELKVLNRRWSRHDCP